MPVQTRRPRSINPTGVPARRAAVPQPGTKAGKSSKRNRRKDPLWARLLLIFGAVLLMVSGGTIVSAKVLIGQATGNIEQDNLLGGAGKNQAQGGGNLEGPIDMLLLGVDAREKNPKDVRADSIIVLHIPASHDQAYLLSIPRDTEAEIPGFGRSKINAAFHEGTKRGKGGWAGGTQLLAKTIQNMTGISFDGAAIINFGGFVRIINALGTIRVCVAHEVPSKHMTYVNGKPMWNADAKKVGGDKKKVVHKKGCKEMEGWEALDYSRQRYGLPNGDYDRQQNQQKVIKAIAKKAMAEGMNDPFKLNKLMQASKGSFIVDTNNVPIETFIFTLKGVAANDLVLLRTNGGTFHGNENKRETFDPTTRAMFAAVTNDRLGEFIINNPRVLVPANKK